MKTNQQCTQQRPLSDTDVISGCGATFKATSVNSSSHNTETCRQQPKSWAVPVNKALSCTYIINIITKLKDFQGNCRAKTLPTCTQNYGELKALTSRASRDTNPVMEKPSMMSSSAEVDSFRFLRGGRGRDEEASRSPPCSESEEK